MQALANVSQRLWILTRYMSLRPDNGSRCPQSSLVICMSISWLKVEERLTWSLLIFCRKCKTSCLFNKLLAHSSDTHAYPQYHQTSQSPEQTMGGAQYYIEPWLHGTLIPHQVTDAAVESYISLIQIHLMEQRVLWCTQTLVHALYIHVRCNIVVWWYYTFCIVDM
jgi:hypothetical protein